MDDTQNMNKSKKMVVTVTLFLALAEILFFNAMARTVGAYITADLGDVSLFTLMNTIFFLCSTLAMPISCKLGDIFGRRNMIALGIGIYSVSMLFAGLSTNMLMHVIFRGGQGLGQGFMLANALTAIGEIHAGADKAKYLGMYGTITGICNIFGPTIGGVIYDKLGWRAVFYATIVIGVIVVALLLTMYPNQKKDGDKYIDIPGFLTLAVAATGAVLGFNWAGSKGFNNPTVIVMFVLAVVGAVAFVFVEKKSKNPLIPFDLFTNKYFVLCLLAACAIWPCMFSSNAYFTLYAQAIRGMAATASGAILSVQAIVNTIAGTVVGFAIAFRKGRIKEIMIAIIALYAVSMFLQSTCTATTPIWLLYVMMCIIGFGNGAVMGAFTAGIQNNLAKEDISAGTATLQCFQSLTGTIGLSIMGLVLSKSFAGKLATVVPEGLLDFTTEEAIAPFKSATGLMNVAGTKEFAATLPERGQELFNTMMQNVNAAYASSLRIVFIILLCLLAVALVSMILLKENKPVEAETAAEAK